MDSETVKDSFEYHQKEGNSATVISAKVSDPTGYGRIVRDENGAVTAIVEQKDADEVIAKINEVNSGGFWFDTEKLLSVLGEIKSDNNAKEYYLPDALKLLLKKNEKYLDADRNIIKQKVKDAAEKIDPELIELLISEPEIKKEFLWT